jgi:hypothetical protein
MEMLAIYFALADNQHQINRIVSSQKKKHLIVNIRSDSKTNVEQAAGSNAEDIHCNKEALRKDDLYMIIIFNHL